MTLAPLHINPSYPPLHKKELQPDKITPAQTDQMSLTSVYTPFLIAESRHAPFLHLNILLKKYLIKRWMGFVVNTFKMRYFVLLVQQTSIFTNHSGSMLTVWYGINLSGTHSSFHFDEIYAYERSKIFLWLDLFLAGWHVKTALKGDRCCLFNNRN